MTYKMSFRSLAFIAASIVTFAACGDAAEKKDTATTTKAATLDGTWKSGCILDDDAYSIQIFTVAGSATTVKSTVYTKAGCADADKLMTAEVTATTVFTGTKADTTPSKVMLTPESDAAVAQMTAACASLTWKKGTATNATTCDNMKELSAKKHDLAEVKEGKLYMGKVTATLDRSTEAKRPTELDTANPLTKQ